MKSFKQYMNYIRSKLVIKSSHISIDEYLNRWSLISGYYSVSDGIVPTESGKSRRIVTTIFFVLYATRLSVSLILPEDSVWLYYIGDPSIVTKNKSSSKFMTFLHLIACIKAILTVYQFWRCEQTNRMQWLSTTLITRGKTVLF